MGPYLLQKLVQQWVLVLHVRHVIQIRSQILQGDPGSECPQGLHHIWFSASFLIHSQEHLIMIWVEAERHCVVHTM